MNKFESNIEYLKDDFININESIANINNDKKLQILMFLFNTDGKMRTLLAILKGLESI